MVDVISNIVGGVGSAIQGIGQMQQSKVDDVCGKKPGIFAKKAKKDAYDACIAKSAAAKMELMKQQTEMAKRTEETKPKNKTGLYIGIAVAVLLAVVIIVVIRRRKK